MKLTPILGFATVLWGFSTVPPALAQDPIQVEVSVDSSHAGTIGAPREVTVEASLAIEPLPGDDYFAAERRGRKQLIELFRQPAFSEENLDYSWSIMEPGQLVIERIGSPAEDGRSMLVGRALWKIASLEAGERELPALLWTGYELPQLDPLITAGVLEESEESPRPLAGFPDPPPARSPEQSSPLTKVLVGAGVGAGILGAFLLRRRTSEVLRTPKERQADIERRFAELTALVAPGKQPTPEQLRAAHFTLTACLRESVELKRGLVETAMGSRSQAALTDHEWANALDAPAEIHDFFAEVAMVKYAGDVPTVWGLAERIDAAKELQVLLTESAPSGGSQ